jgi:hypothetical protein
MERTPLRSKLKEKKDMAVGFFYRHRKGIFLTVVVTVFSVVANNLSSKDKNVFKSWLETASDEELEDEYEAKRLDWVKNGEGDITYEMRKINNEMIRRDNEKYEKEHPNAKPVSHGNGWYLPNDDD